MTGRLRFAQLYGRSFSRFGSLETEDLPKTKRLVHGTLRTPAFMALTGPVFGRVEEAFSTA